MRNALVYPGSGNIWGKLASGIGILALSSLNVRLRTEKG